jgi:hypothetical protein
MPCISSDCVPELALIAIGRYAQIGSYGFGCANGGGLPNGTLGYLTQKIDQRGKSNANSTTSKGSALEGCNGKSSVNSNSQNQGVGALESIYSLNPKIDGYGRLIIDITAQSSIDTSYSSSSQTTFSHVQQLSSPGFPTIDTTASSKSESISSSKQTCTFIPCDYSQCQISDCGYFVCEDDCTYSDSSSSNPSITFNGQGSCLYSDGSCSAISYDEAGQPYPNQCEASNSSNDSTNCNFSIPCPELTEASSTCTSITYECLAETSSGSQSCLSACGTTGPAANTSSSVSISSKTLTVSQAFTISDAKKLSVQQVETLLALDEANSPKSPCGEICETNDGKDGCWIGASGTITTPVSNTGSSYYSAFKLKIGMYKKDMDDQKILRVKGTVYFYENSLPECCCGTGNTQVIFSASFNINNSKNMEINGGKDEFCSADVIKKNNDELQDYVDSNIVACYVIDKVTYI